MRSKEDTKKDVELTAIMSQGSGFGDVGRINNISSKIDNAIGNGNAIGNAIGNFHLTLEGDEIPRLDIESVIKLKESANRGAVIDFFISVIKALEYERTVTYAFLKKLHDNHEFQLPVTLALISRLMDNSQAISKEIVRISRNISEMQMSWEAMDKNADDLDNSGNSAEDNALLRKAKDIRPDNFSFGT